MTDMKKTYYLSTWGGCTLNNAYHACAFGRTVRAVEKKILECERRAGSARPHRIWKVTEVHRSAH